MRDRAHVAVPAFVNCPCAFTPGNQLGPEAGARLASVRDNSIVERFTDAGDVTFDNDPVARMSALTLTPSTHDVRLEMLNPPPRRCETYGNDLGLHFAGSRPS